MNAHKHLGLVTALIITIGIVLSIQIVSGTVYHIDPSTGSMDNDGSSGTPWSTLADVVADRKTSDGTFSGGDTILLYTGYHGDVTYLSGSNTADVVIKAAAGQRPVMKRLYFGNASHWHIEGIVFSPYEADGTMSGEILVRMQADFMTIKNCTLYSRWDEDAITAGDWINKVPEFAISVQGANTNIIGNYMRNISFGVEIRSGNENCLIEYNTVKNFSGDGFRVLSSNCTVQYNTVMDNYNVDANHDDALQSYGQVNNVTVRGNLFVNLTDPTRDFKGDMHGIGCFDGPYSGWHIENNVIIVCTWNGISMLGVSNTTIINNTVLASETFMEDNVTEAQAWPVGVRTWIRISDGKGGQASTNNIVRNNLVNHVAIYEASHADIDNNVTGDNAADFCNDFANGDYTLKPNYQYMGMVAIDGGMADGAPAVDFAGNTRPQGNAVDVGAYESPYSSTGGGAPVVVTGADMTLDGYVEDGNNPGIMMVNPALGDPPQTGTATFTFSGETGTYDLSLAVVPENDGTPRIRVLIDGTEVINYLYPEDAGYYTPSRDRLYVDVEDLAIDKGATVQITGTAAASTPTSPSQGGAWARFEKLLFIGEADMSVTDLDFSRAAGATGIGNGIMMDMAGRVVNPLTAGTGMYLTVTDGQVQKVFIR